MSTKQCPSCSEFVPDEAPRCKYCFHDFTAVPEKKNSPLMALLVLLAAMAAVAFGVFSYTSGRAVDCQVDIDQESAAITWLCQYPEGPRVDRVLRFDEVSRVRFVAGDHGKDKYKVFACESGDECHLVESASQPTAVKGLGARLAHLTGAEFEEEISGGPGLGRGMLED